LGRAFLLFGCVATTRGRFLLDSCHASLDIKGKIEWGEETGAPEKRSWTDSLFFLALLGRYELMI